MGTVGSTIEDYRQARESLAAKIALLRETAEHGVLPPEVDAAEEHYARLSLAETHGYPDDAWHSLVAARRYLATLPRPLLPIDAPPRRREMTLYSPFDAHTSRTQWQGTDGSPLALAAVCGVEVRDVAPLFASSAWVKRTLPALHPILDEAGLRTTFHRTVDGPPRLGLGVVQIDGPWRMGRDDFDRKRKENSYSHWVAIHKASSDLWVFDPFDLAWLHASVWENRVLPFVKQKRGVAPSEGWIFRGFYAVETVGGRAFHTVTRAPAPSRLAG